MYEYAVLNALCALLRIGDLLWLLARVGRAAYTGRCVLVYRLRLRLRHAALVASASMLVALRVRALVNAVHCALCTLHSCPLTHTSSTFVLTLFFWHSPLPFKLFYATAQRALHFFLFLLLLFFLLFFLPSSPHCSSSSVARVFACNSSSHCIRSPVHIFSEEQ